MLRSAAWLRRRVEGGASVAEMAAETGRTESAVRKALRGHGIDPPSRQPRRGRSDPSQPVDWAMAEVDWRKGYPIVTIARLYGLTSEQVRYRFRDVPRVPLPQRGSKYPELNDPAWLRVELARGQTVAAIARTVGCAGHVVVAALRRHRPGPRPDRFIGSGGATAARWTGSGPTASSSTGPPRLIEPWKGEAVADDENLGADRHPDHRDCQGHAGRAASPIQQPARPLRSAASRRRCKRRTTRPASAAVVHRTRVRIVKTKKT